MGTQGYSFKKESHFTAFLIESLLVDKCYTTGESNRRGKFEIYQLSLQLDNCLVMIYKNETVDQILDEVLQLSDEGLRISEPPGYENASHIKICLYPG